MAEEDTVVSGVAGRYASALFSLAQDQREGEAVADALARFDALIAESPDLQRLVRSPVFSAAEQLKALDAILAQAENQRRGRELRPACDDEAPAVLHPRNDRRLPQTVRQVPRRDAGGSHERRRLDRRNVASLKELLRTASGGREVDLDMKVDPSIIGGLIVKLGSRMVDGSLKTKLNAIRLAMKEVG